jgi:hypothetical protein
MIEQVIGILWNFRAPLIELFTRLFGPLNDFILRWYNQARQLSTIRFGALDILGGVKFPPINEVTGSLLGGIREVAGWRLPNIRDVSGNMFNNIKTLNVFRFSNLERISGGLFGSISRLAGPIFNPIVDLVNRSPILQQITSPVISAVKTYIKLGVETLPNKVTESFTLIRTAQSKLLDLYNDLTTTKGVQKRLEEATHTAIAVLKADTAAKIEHNNQQQNEHLASFITGYDKERRLKWLLDVGFEPLYLIASGGDDWFRYMLERHLVGVLAKLKLKELTRG